MKISKKAEYAIRAVLAMSRSAPGTLFSIHTLSMDEGIPLKFLEQILLVLRKGGILQSRRGAGGGYQLAKLPQHISLGEILYQVDGPLDILPTPAGASETTLKVCFGELQSMMEAWLSKMTIADVLQKEASREFVNFEI